MGRTPAAAPPNRPPSLLAAVMIQHGISQRKLIELSRLPNQTISDAYHGQPGRMETYLTITEALSPWGVRLRDIAPWHANRLNGVSV